MATIYLSTAEIERLAHEQAVITEMERRLERQEAEAYAELVRYQNTHKTHQKRQRRRPEARRH